MRATAITVHNNQEVEIFVEKRKDGFGLWIVGPIKGSRTVIDHHLTHDDLEAWLAYAKPGDLVWRDATASEIPTEKHQNAVEMEATIKQGKFMDYEDWPEESQRSVARHFGSISLLTTDRKETNAANKAILGRWTDGVVTLNIEPNNKLGWSCSNRNHPFNIGEKVHGHAPDWWNFAMWRLHLMNDKHKCGTHVGVLRADEHELHFEGGGPHRLATVFHRD